MKIEHIKRWTSNIERPTRRRRASTCPPPADRILNERQKQGQEFC